MTKLLVCGTRDARYDLINFDDIMYDNYGKGLTLPLVSRITEIIEGCCPNSADVLAEKFAKSMGIPLNHFPATSGNYLKRNIEMATACDEVLAFWDKFSYGTCHTIAHAVMQGKPVRIIVVKK